jgi:6-phosphogluconolactonase
MIKINRYETSEHMLHIAAHDFLAELEAVCEKKPFFDVALSGGSTAKEFFQSLVPIAKDHPKLKNIRFFFSDERAVPLESPHSNAGNAWQLLKPLGIKREQFFPMYEQGKALDAAKKYQELLLNKLDLLNGVPSFDLLYLGLGLDGHIASLFPNSPLLKGAKELVCETSEPGIEFERITLMPKMLHAAKKVCLLAIGEKKMALIDQMMAEGSNELPAQLILRKPKNLVTVLLA